jgi:hypothetical protein
MATFRHGDSVTKTHFGGKGCGDYIKYSRQNHALGDAKRRAYIKRHGAAESWRDPTTAATLSRFILWEKRTLKNAIQAYKRRFRV